MELDMDAVLEMSVEMMATTVALAYPIFIKIAQEIVEIMTTHKESNAQLEPPIMIVDRLKK
jgi:hypothetical protein